MPNNKTFLFVLNHPAHYHLFKHTIKILQTNGHRCDIIARDKDVLCQLLVDDNIEFLKFEKKNNFGSGIFFSSIANLIKKILFVWKYSIRNKPDIMIGTDWAISIVGRFRSIPNIIFNEDDTFATPENNIFYPFSKFLVLPACCDRELWEKKKISYPGYHELAYLHPRYFKYDESIVENAIGSSKPYIIIRLVSLTASHDIGKVGLAKNLIQKIIDISGSRFKIFISFEVSGFNQFKQYSYKFSPSIMHHVLAGAHLVIGDSQTMIAEAAVLGTPAIRLNDFVGKLGYLEELESRYGLSFGFLPSQHEEFLAKVEELLNVEDLELAWQKKLDKLYIDKIDVTKFMVWLLGKYPESIKRCKQTNLIERFG